MNLIIGGDFHIANSSIMKQPLIDPALVELFAFADCRIVNLESPLTANEPKNRILKTGPHLCSSEEKVLPYLKQLNVNLVTLANNHVYDYGNKGLEDTLQRCQKHDISTVGAGLTLEQARATWYREIEGRAIAVVNFAENEWCNANDRRGGANPYDLIENARQIQQARKNADVVLVIIHGGHELYHYPSPRMVKHYRYFAEQGATAIIGHHTHCISGYEVHQNVPIFYSLGNLLFDSTTTFPGWYQGFLLNLKIDGNCHPAWKLIPYSQSKPKQGIWALNEAERESFVKKIDEISNIIECPSQLRAQWTSFVETRSQFYLGKIAVPWGFLRIIQAKLCLFDYFLNKKSLNYVHNLVRCEAHRDVLLSSLERYKNE